MDYRGQQMYAIDNGSRTFYAPKNAETIQRYMPSLYTIPMEMKQGGDLLVIASGGGQEVTMASHFGMKRIDAVEIARPIVTDIVRIKKDEPGNPYLLPNVHYYIADGRSVIMRSKQRYDMIEMLDVNFATVAGQISHAWSPNFVSTQEAFSEYIEHLKEDGVLCFSLISNIKTPLAGEKNRRLASLVAGMKMAGIIRPEDHLAILSRVSAYGYRTMFMVKKTPVHARGTGCNPEDRGLAQPPDRDPLPGPGEGWGKRPNPTARGTGASKKPELPAGGDASLQIHATHSRLDRDPGNPQRAGHSDQ